MPFDSQCVTDSVFCWNVVFVASVMFCGGDNVLADGALWSPIFALIWRFVDHYFGSGGAKGFRLKLGFPKRLVWAEIFCRQRDD